MASAQICPIVGTTTSVLPPNHPSYDESDPNLRCPVTNAMIAHHGNVHNHPSATITNSADAMDAEKCPALKNANNSASLTDATCPVVGPVSAYLPPGHPSTDTAEAGAVCPITNATLEHHAQKVHKHPQVQAGVCPVAGKAVEA